jgi:hypothetical protein
VYSLPDQRFDINTMSSSYVTLFYRVVTAWRQYYTK